MAAGTQRLRLVSFGNMAAVAGALAGAVYGYTQADIYSELSSSLDGATPLEGAAIFAVIGFVLARLAGFVLRSVLQMIVFFGIIVLLICVFREPIRDRVGFDPAAFLEKYFGMAIERVQNRN